MNEPSPKMSEFLKGLAEHGAKAQGIKHSRWWKKKDTTSTPQESNELKFEISFLANKGTTLTLLVLNLMLLFGLFYVDYKMSTTVNCSCSQHK